MLLFTLGEMNGEVEVLEEGFKIPQCGSIMLHQKQNVQRSKRLTK